MKLILIISLICIFYQSSIHAETYYITLDKEKTKAEFFKKDGVLLNDLCIENISVCKAYTILKKAPVALPKKLQMKNFGSIADAYCNYIGGVPISLTDTKNNEFAFCSFEDLSIISSWDLYNKHKAKIKK